MEKYDAEIAKCTDYYAKQCALMEVARGQISAANFVAASSRNLILDAEANIKRCEKEIPAVKQELKEHNAQCKDNLHKMNKRLKVIMNDVAVMTMILKMSDCDAKLMQMDKFAMLRCENQCTGKGNITFNHVALENEVNQLKSPGTQELILDGFAELFDDGDSVGSMQLMSVKGSQYRTFVSDDDDEEAEDDMEKPDGKCRAELYQHGDFKGWKASFGNGVYDFKKFKGAGAKNDDASAIKVFGIDCEAAVYEHGDFTGWKAVFGNGEHDHASFVKAGAKNDHVSSIKVYKKKKMKKAPFNRKPVPMVKVPPNPCSDPNQGAPSAANKRAAKCTLKKSPQCYKLQQRFLQIQSGIIDQRDELMDEISKLEQTCNEMSKSLEDNIENDNALLQATQTKLAAATEKEASAGEMARQVNKENEGYNKDLLKQMKSCSGNYVNFETELCALKKIRGDLYKKMQKGHNGFFQDCELAKWTPEACTKKCAGGEQKLIRSVLKHPGKKGQEGAKCLPLSAKRKCNLSPCPIDCKLASWTGWSKCSAKCGGGVTTRVRDVKTAMRYDGKPCGETTQTKVCNAEACEKDCVLKRWTKWSSCSKDCDGGSQKRVRFIKEAAEGDGKCAGEWDKERLQYKDCNMVGCAVEDPKKVLPCKNSLDIVLLLDGTPKSGKKAWAAEVKAANLLVDAFSGEGNPAKPNFAVIHYTGPRTWSGVSKCTGEGKGKVDMEKTCKVRIAQHFEQDTKKVKSVISGLQYQPGSKLLSLALMTATSEFPLGRADKRTVVIVFIDGEPLSYRKTKLASLAIRKSARLLYVVVNKFAPLKSIKKWASRRWEENLVVVKSAEELGKAETGTHIIANICPKHAPKLKMAPKKKR